MPACSRSGGYHGGRGCCGRQELLSRVSSEMGWSVRGGDTHGTGRGWLSISRGTGGSGGSPTSSHCASTRGCFHCCTSLASLTFQQGEALRPGSVSPSIQHLWANGAVSKGWTRMIKGKNGFSACPSAAASFPPSQHRVLGARQCPPTRQGTLTPTPTPVYPILLYIRVRMSAFTHVVGACAPTKLLEALGKRWAETGARGGAEQIASDGSVESLKRDKN